MMATANWSDVSKETTNVARVCKLLIDGGTEVLRSVFDSIHPSHSLRSHLLDPKNHSILRSLYSKKVLFKEQWSKLYPTGASTVDSNSFDISLLYVLLRSICNLPTPTTGWNNLPAATSIKTEDDIVRIKCFRNHIAHIQKSSLSDADFEKHWNDIASTLVRLGGAHYQAQIDRLSHVSMDPEEDKYYIKCLKEWYKCDGIITKALEATEERLAQKMDETQFEVTQKMDSTKKELTEKIDHQAERMDEVHRKLGEFESTLQASSRSSVPDTSVQDAELFSQNLKTVVQNKLQSQEEFLISPLLERMGLEDIFTQLVMYQGPTENSKSSQSDLLGGKTSIEIHNIQDVFIDKAKKENPKSLLIKGNAGIGKSLFSRKLLHDWAKNCIFNESADNPVIKFAFLLPFRQLNMLTEENLNLRELLNLCFLLDENTMINNSIIEYIIQHPEQLFILFDGFDEYKHRQNITSDFDSKYPNDPRYKMPVPALVSKLIKKKILFNSVVMVTSRPGKAEEMKNVHFDRCIDILGYSEEQVIQYVTKHFNSNEEMQTKALSTIKENQDYLKFGRIPLMCLLMCVYMESNITNSSECFPKTLTEFYSEVVQCIEKNYNKAIQKDNLDEKTSSSVIEKMKDKMSELAAESLVRGKYSFNEEDFGKLNISELELTYLKCSSLLFCESSVRKSALSSEVRHEYCFNHTTFHEYFAARYFVKQKKIPAKTNLSDVTLQFMAGLMDPEKHKQLMKQLLKHIYKREKDKEAQSATSLTCLYEFGDKTLAKQLVQKNKHNRYWNSIGVIRLSNIDYKVVVMLVDILTTLNKEQSLSSSSPVPHSLYIEYSPLTFVGVEILFKSLTNTLCTLTKLFLWSCNIDDKCCECLSRYVQHTKLTHLNLWGNNITDNGVLSIVKCCNLKLKYLILSGNKIIDIKHVRELFKDKYPDLVLVIWQ